MKRLCCLTLIGCEACPFFYQKNQYVHRAVGCEKLDIEITRVAGIDEDKRIESVLRNWFENRCPLPEARDFGKMGKNNKKE